MTSATRTELCDTHTDETHKLSAVHLVTASSTPEIKVDTCVEMDHYHHDQLPQEQHTLARNLESTNAMGQGEQINISESTQRSNNFDDISNFTVSTFSHYAFNTL